MKRNLEDFLTIHKQKNGKIKIYQSRSKEGNIYKFLYDLGYRKVKDKLLYFQYKDRSIVPKKIFEIKKDFLQVILDNNYVDNDKNVDLDRIEYWFLDKNPIRQNGLLEFYIEEEVSDELIQEIKQFRMYADLDT